MLFHWLPGDKIRTEVDEITTSGLALNRIAGPISITKDLQKMIVSMLNEKAMVGCTLKVAKDAFDKLPMLIGVGACIN